MEEHSRSERTGWLKHRVPAMEQLGLGWKDKGGLERSMRDFTSWRATEGQGRLCAGKGHHKNWILGK